MDWLDYRQALGLSFNDDQKKNLFIKRIEMEKELWHLKSMFFYQP